MSMQTGVIAKILLAEGVVDEKRLRHAERIRSKLESYKPLLDVLAELGFGAKEDLREVLRRHGREVPLGELLVEFGLVSGEDMQVAVDLHAESNGEKSLPEVLVEHHFVSDADLSRVMAEQLGLPLVEPSVAAVDRRLLAMAPMEWLVRHQFLPWERRDGKVVVAFPDPTHGPSVDAAETVFGAGCVFPAIAGRRKIAETLDRLAAGETGDGLDESGVVSAVDDLLLAAVERGASDIHIEPLSECIRVRFREDGVLVPYREYPLDLAPAISTRIKVLCQADITERRRHQDGRFFHKAGEHELDLRVSFYVTVSGEKIVLRLLTRERRLQKLEDVGMAPRMVERFLDDVLETPSGVILVTGPTGSGKTSTLYSCVNRINDPNTSIITAEDPVEYMIDGIGQCSINNAIDLTFEESLRAVVRQDPDVIVIGEIRDAFSAKCAIQAALTGHKVLTTFHTEDTIGALLRMLNMDIEPFLISSTVVGILAQRLLRRVCDECAVEDVPDASQLRRLGYTPADLADASLRKGRGCDRCHQTGYRGRLAVFELLVLDELVRDAVLQRKTAHEVRQMSRDSSGLISLLEDGIVKAASGVTTLDEALRMCPRLDKPRSLRDLRRQLGV